MSGGHPPKQDREGEDSGDKNGYFTSSTRWSFMTLCLWGRLLDSTADTRVHPHFSQTPDMSAWITGVFMVSPCRKTLCELRHDTPGQSPAQSLPGLRYCFNVGKTLRSESRRRQRSLRWEESLLFVSRKRPGASRKIKSGSG